MSHISPAEHTGQKRPHAGCNATRCWCKWIRFHISRSNAKLRKGGAGA
jgi:hypothetical protein